MDVDSLAEAAYRQYKYLASTPVWLDLPKAVQAGWRVAVDEAASLAPSTDIGQAAQRIYAEYRDTVLDWDDTGGVVPEWESLSVDERQGWLAAVPIIIENVPFL